MEIPQGIYLPLYSSVVLSFPSCHFFYLQLLCHYSEFVDDIYKIIISIYICIKDFSTCRNDSLEYSLPYLHCTLNIEIRPLYHPKHHATFVVELYVITPYKTNTIYMSHCKDIQNHKASPEYTQMLSLSTCNRVIKLQELIEFVHSYVPTLLTQSI